MDAACMNSMSTNPQPIHHRPQLLNFSQLLVEPTPHDPEKTKLLRRKKISVWEGEDHRWQQERFAPFDFISARNGHILSDERSKRASRSPAGWLRTRKKGGLECHEAKGPGVADLEEDGEICKIEGCGRYRLGRGGGEEGPMVVVPWMGAEGLCWDDRGLVFAATPHGAFSSEAIGWSLPPFRALGWPGRRLRCRGLWLRAWGGKLYCHDTWIIVDNVVQFCT